MDRGSAHTLSDDAREVAWWVLAGTAAGAIAGLVVGGIGGRLAMLLLRVTSGDEVVGVVSDDGFEIGVVTTQTVSFLLGMTFLGAVNGALYAAVRGAIPRRLRLPLWALFAATVGGANVVHEDGVDFTVLQPVELSIALFVVLPGVAAAVVVLLTERWAERAPFRDRRLSVGLVAAALVGTIGCVVAAAVWALTLVLRRLGLARPLGRAAAVVVPVALVVVSVAAGLALAGTARNLL